MKVKSLHLMNIPNRKSMYLATYDQGKNRYTILARLIVPPVQFLEELAKTGVNFKEGK